MRAALWAVRVVVRTVRRTHLLLGRGGVSLPLPNILLLRGGLYGGLCERVRVMKSFPQPRKPLVALFHDSLFHDSLWKRLLGPVVRYQTLAAAAASLVRQSRLENGGRVHSPRTQRTCAAARDGL